MQVLDIATGAGLSAEAALAAVGPTGHVIAADVSPAMAEKARERLGKAPNASVSVEDGQALSFADCSFDVVIWVDLSGSLATRQTAVRGGERKFACLKMRS
jgi:ubiquinone/menaquinone biosynthesis C-methylase UbiE